MTPTVSYYYMYALLLMEYCTTLRFKDFKHQEIGFSLSMDLPQFCEGTADIPEAFLNLLIL
jgi:hypothetical protein